ncbi:hypothetical protein OG894_45070 (plasmid) [Streptomyces sp. NBC_01724]|uniref:hypothetical protein n=1 Tax=Streptomyces sp. NBC_01724 TaxID=2975922 RepID=UPI002E33EB4D|nr:hypothetical protein [Streptomyces sp. NBC_01724]
MIIVIIVSAATLAVIAAMPMLEVLRLLGGAGLVAVLTVGLINTAPTRSIRLAIRAALTSGPTA